MASRGWVCRRTRCGHLNPPAKRKCENCQAPKPKKRVPAHRQALRDYSYEDYLVLNWDIHGASEQCAICARHPKTRRLDRDHDHATGNPRGLLCSRCNQRLERGGDTAEWLSAALGYVQRVNRHYGVVA